MAWLFCSVCVFYGLFGSARRSYNSVLIDVSIGFIACLIKYTHYGFIPGGREALNLK